MHISLPLWQTITFSFLCPQKIIPPPLVTLRVWNADTGDPHPLFTVYVIFVVPALTAVTKPVLTFTVATALLVEVQVPPELPVLL